MKVVSIKTDNIKVSKNLIIKTLISNDIQYIDMGDELLVETDLLIRFELVLNNEITNIDRFIKFGNVSDILNKDLMDSIDIKDELDEIIDKKKKTDLKIESHNVKTKTKEYKRRIKHDKGRY